MPEYFRFEQEKIHPKRVGIVIERLDSILSKLDIPESALLDTSSVDSLTVLSADQMNESDVARALNDLIGRIENVSRDDEDLRDNFLNHKPFRALYKRAIEIQKTK